MRRAVLLAHPAGHSLSPTMHDAAFAAAGLNARYEAWDVPPEALADVVARLREPEFLGANVTVPHKRAVVAHLDGVDPEAAAIGAVNTVRREGGRLIGANTDAAGFLLSLREAGLEPAGRAVVLLGAGGAARAVAWALLGAGVRELRIVNRTRATAEALASALTEAASARDPDAGGVAERDGSVRDVPVRVASVDDGGVHADADWWVNATSVGMVRGGVDPDASPLPAAAFGSGAGAGTEGAAIDLVYRPRRTRFLRDAEAAGLRTLDGLPMLLHQGAASFRAWTGREAPLEAMRSALEAALADGAPA